jgi:hypothetical protein
MNTHQEVIDFINNIQPTAEIYDGCYRYRGFGSSDTVNYGTEYITMKSFIGKPLETFKDYVSELNSPFWKFMYINTSVKSSVGMSAAAMCSLVRVYYKVNVSEERTNIITRVESDMTGGVDSRLAQCKEYVKLHAGALVGFPVDVFRIMFNLVYFMSNTTSRSECDAYFEQLMKDHPEFREIRVVDKWPVRPPVDRIDPLKIYTAITNNKYYKPEFMLDDTETDVPNSTAARIKYIRTIDSRMSAESLSATSMSTPATKRTDIFGVPLDTPTWGHADSFAAWVCATDAPRSRRSSVSTPLVKPDTMPETFNSLTFEP